MSFIPKFKYGKYLGLRYRALNAFKRKKYDRAEYLADQLLDIAKNYEDDWNFSNALHHAYLIRGRVYLAQGDIEGAEKELILAGSVKGSPQLDSFGPNMTLAHELLLVDRREVVLQYLKKCSLFWEFGNEYLVYWKHQITKGEVPNFGRNMEY